MAERILASTTTGDPNQGAAAPSFPFPRLYRAHISAASSHEAERTAFVESSSYHGAMRKIANAVAAVEMRTPDQVEERVYNCHSARELIDEGLSDDIELRLFETGWWGGRAVGFVENPLFLVAAPALIRKWAQITEVSHAQE